MGDLVWGEFSKGRAYVTAAMGRIMVNMNPLYWI